MIPEAVLVAVLVIVFIADFATANSPRRNWLNPLMCILMAALTVVCVLPQEPVTAFGEMYVTSQAVNVMKAILAGGSLVVCIMSRLWMAEGPQGNKQEAEFYMLVASTLLGMFIMMSSGHFLMFYLGLEMASIPMACLVAFDRHRNNSAEGAAKYILTASFSSGVMLFGLSFLYAHCGTLYFSDENGVAKIAGSSDGWYQNDGGWYYYDEDQKRVRFTQGMPSRPFMYETARELERQLKRTAREVFRQND